MVSLDVNVNVNVCIGRSSVDLLLQSSHTPMHLQQNGTPKRNTKPLGRGPLSSFPPDPLGLVDKVQQGGGVDWLLGVTG